MARTKLREERSVGAGETRFGGADWRRPPLEEWIFSLIYDVVFDEGGVNDVFDVFVTFDWEDVVDEEVANVVVVGRLEGLFHLTWTRRQGDRCVGRM